MDQRWLHRINLQLSALAAILFLFVIYFFFQSKGEIASPIVKVSQGFLPKNSFEFQATAYEAIGGPFLTLNYTPAALNLPDLRSHLTYHGTNGRPDASLNTVLLHFTLAGAKSPASLAPGQKLYLVYDKQQSPPKYTFSPNNAQTSLWIEAQVKDDDTKEIAVTIGMEDENGALITEPKAHNQFALTEKELPRSGPNVQWDIGPFRADPTLLARQHTRWFGTDLFLENHGGSDFSLVMGKQRIDFGDDEEAYSCYLQQGDALIWKDDRWQEVPLGPDSLGHPLLHLKKVEERMMSFDLWDNEGKNKVVLNLVKSIDPWTPHNIQHGFKFVGSRTRSQYTFEINNERVTLRNQDWLVMHEGKWVKLNTPESIDDYVNRKTKGPLLIFEGIVKNDDEQMIVGTLYNASRTDSQEVEWPLHNNPAIPQDIVEKARMNAMNSPYNSPYNSYNSHMHPTFPPG